MADQTIFIQIAYRDSELLPSMRDAVDKAKYPSRLTFGVCFQEQQEYPHRAAFFGSRQERLVLNIYQVS